MAAVSNRTCCVPLIPCVEKNEKPIAMMLAALVFLAGSATAGVALAGYLPYHYFYTGIGVIALELVLVGVCLGISYCHHQKNSSHSIEEEQADNSLSVNSLQLGSESSEISVEIEAEVKIKEPNQKIVPLNKLWLPEEMWVRIFNYLEPKDLSSAFHTCKSWNQLVQIDSIWSRWILEQDWHEDNPQCFKVWRHIHSLKGAPKGIFYQKLSSSWIADPACSGNQLAFYCLNASAVHVWKIEKGCLSKHSKEFVFAKFAMLDLACSNEIVYIISHKLLNWNVVTGELDEWNADPLARHVFVNQAKVIVSGNELSFWDKKTHLQLDKQCFDVGKFLVYKDTLIFVEKGKKCLKMRDLKNGLEEDLITDPIVLDFCLSGGILVAQTILHEPTKRTALLRYDIDAKTWLAEIDPGEGYYLIGALGGMIIVKLQGSMEAKIFDFRH